MPLLEPRPIETPRVLLRRLAEADLSALMAVNSDDAVTGFLPYASWQSMADAEAWHQRMQALEAGGGAWQFVLVLRTSGVPIGTSLLFRHDEPHARIELGYALGRAHWGQGLMREALEVLLDWAFGVAEVRRVEAQVDPRNHASLQLLQRLGFEREGLLRERVVSKGETVDLCMHGLLATQWQARARALPAAG